MVNETRFQIASRDQTVNLPRAQVPRGVCTLEDQGGPDAGSARRRASEAALYTTAARNGRYQVLTRSVTSPARIFQRRIRFQLHQANDQPGRCTSVAGTSSAVFPPPRHRSSVSRRSRFGDRRRTARYPRPLRAGLRKFGRGVQISDFSLFAQDDWRSLLADREVRRSLPGAGMA